MDGATHHQFDAFPCEDILASKISKSLIYVQHVRHEHYIAATLNQRHTQINTHNICMSVYICVYIYICSKMFR